MVFAALFLIPGLVGLICFMFFEKKITLKEFAVQMVAQAVIAGISAGILYYANITDHEVWNGTVAQKTREKVSCEHSYPCNCHEVSCGKDCTTIHCDTCYEHSYDIDWAVYTTNQERLTIDRLDSQGLQEPPRWDQVTLGEPTSQVHLFTNYIKGSPDTLFRHQGLVEKYQQYLPGYPQNVYDYYRLDRLVLVNGANVENPKLWNYQLAQLNGALGRRKQCNIITIFAKNLPNDYFYAVEQSWIGGKQNDVIILTGVDSDNKISWVGIMAWTKNELFKVKLRDDLLALSTVDRDQYMQAIQTDVEKYFVRQHMSDYQYLRASIKPTKIGWIISMIIGLLVAIGLSVLFYKIDLNEAMRGY